MVAGPLAKDSVGIQSSIQTTKPYVILASSSPRRKDLLKQLIDEFEVIDSGVNEEGYSGVDAWVAAQDLAQAKANAVWKARPEAIVIGADTVVTLGDRGFFNRFVEALSFGRLDGLRCRREGMSKPSDPADAVRMLQSLSNRRHYVLTGVCVLTPTFSESFVEVTVVRFRHLRIKEIGDYVATGEPMDKAGAYAIQGGAKDFVVSVEGSLSNVIGLPLERLEPILRRALNIQSAV